MQHTYPTVQYSGLVTCACPDTPEFEPRKVQNREVTDGPSGFIANQTLGG